MHMPGLGFIQGVAKTNRTTQTFCVGMVSYYDVMVETSGEWERRPALRTGVVVPTQGCASPSLLQQMPTGLLSHSIGTHHKCTITPFVLVGDSTTFDRWNTLAVDYEKYLLPVSRPKFWSVMWHHVVTINPSSPIITLLDALTLIERKMMIAARRARIE